MNWTGMIFWSWWINGLITGISWVLWIGQHGVAHTDDAWPDQIGNRISREFKPEYCMFQCVIQRDLTKHSMFVFQVTVRWIRIIFVSFYLHDLIQFIMTNASILQSSVLKYFLKTLDAAFDAPKRSYHICNCWWWNYLSLQFYSLITVKFILQAFSTFVSLLLFFFIHIQAISCNLNILDGMVSLVHPQLVQRICSYFVDFCWD